MCASRVTILKVTLEQTCAKCKNTIKQIVWFYEKDSRIDTEAMVWRWRCPLCNGVLDKPTPMEIRQAHTKEKPLEKQKARALSAFAYKLSPLAQIRTEHM